MIEKINSMLQSIGSNFRTYDGLTISSCTGNLMFLTRTFPTALETLEFVQKSCDYYAAKNS